MSIDVSPRRIFLILVAVTGVLVVLHVVGQSSRLFLQHGRLLGFVPFFDMEEETNFPSFWSSILWLIGGVVATLVAFCERNNATKRAAYWGGIAALSYLFAFDETIMIHERLGGWLVEWASARGLRTDGLLYYMWVIPGSLFALTVFCVYLRFLFTLPRRIALLMVGAGALFLSGAIGLELFEGPLHEEGQYKSVLYTVLVTFEETFEMLGVSIFILAMLRHLQDTTGHIDLKFTSR